MKVVNDDNMEPMLEKFSLTLWQDSCWKCPSEINLGYSTVKRGCFKMVDRNRLKPRYRCEGLKSKLVRKLPGTFGTGLLQDLFDVMLLLLYRSVGRIW